MKISIASFASLGLALVACGGGGSSDPGTITSEAAGGTVTSVREVGDALAALDGETAAEASMAMVAINQGILLPQAPGSAPRLDGPGVAPVLVGTATCTPTGCVFDHFGDDSLSYGWIIDGTITRTADGYAFALDVDLTADPTHIHWRMDGAMAITPTLIDGSVHLVADGTAGDASVHWDVTVDYVDIVLDADGCPIGGRIDARSVFEADGHTAFDLEGVVTFGPACGQTSLDR